MKRLKGFCVPVLCVWFVVSGMTFKVVNWRIVMPGWTEIVGATTSAERGPGLLQPIMGATAASSDEQAAGDIELFVATSPIWFVCPSATIENEVLPPALARRHEPDETDHRVITEVSAYIGFVRKTHVVRQLRAAPTLAKGAV